MVSAKRDSTPIVIESPKELFCTVGATTPVMSAVGKIIASDCGVLVGVPCISWAVILVFDAVTAVVGKGVEAIVGFGVGD